MRVVERLEDNSSEFPLIAMLQAGIREGDELLLHSSGPITDLSQNSMLPALDSIRFLFFEPHGGRCPRRVCTSRRNTLSKSPSS